MVGMDTWHQRACSGCYLNGLIRVAMVYTTCYLAGDAVGGTGLCSQGHKDVACDKSVAVRQALTSGTAKILSIVWVAYDIEPCVAGMYTCVAVPILRLASKCKPIVHVPPRSRNEVSVRLVLFMPNIFNILLIFAKVPMGTTHYSSGVEQVVSALTHPPGCAYETVFF
jgi:hypothetical protein